MAEKKGEPDSNETGTEGKILLSEKMKQISLLVRLTHVCISQLPFYILLKTGYLTGRGDKLCH